MKCMRNAWKRTALNMFTQQLVIFSPLPRTGACALLSKELKKIDHYARSHGAPELLKDATFLPSTAYMAEAEAEAEAETEAAIKTEAEAGGQAKG